MLVAVVQCDPEMRCSELASRVPIYSVTVELARYRPVMVLQIPVDLVPEPKDPLSIQVVADGRVGDDDVQFMIDTGA